MPSLDVLTFGFWSVLLYAMFGRTSVLFAVAIVGIGAGIVFTLGLWNPSFLYTDDHSKKKKKLDTSDLDASNLNLWKTIQASTKYVENLGEQKNVPSLASSTGSLTASGSGIVTRRRTSSLHAIASMRVTDIKKVTKMIEHLPSSTTEINWSLCKIGDDGTAKFVKSCKVVISKKMILDKLTVLNLSFNNISDDGVRSLCEVIFKNLKELDISCNMIGKNGGRVLGESLASKFPKLKILQLKHNYLGDDGTKFLCENLQSNFTVETLDLGSNHIGTQGTVAISNLLSKNGRIQSLSLAMNYIGEEGLRVFTIVLSESRMRNDFRLREVDLSGIGCLKEKNTAAHEWIAEMLENNKSIASLSLASNFMGKKGIAVVMEGLQVNRTVSSIDLSYNNIRSQGTQSVASVLEGSTITSLDLSANSIGKEGMEHLIEAVCSNKYLEDLNVSFNNIESGCNNLWKLVSSKTSIRFLNLSNNNLGREGTFQITQNLPNSRLEVLMLNENNIGDDGAAVIATSLKNNPSNLKELHLSTNKIGQQGMLALVEAIRGNQRQDDSFQFSNTNANLDNGNSNGFSTNMQRLIASKLQLVDLRENALPERGEVQSLIDRINIEQEIVVL